MRQAKKEAIKRIMILDICDWKLVMTVSVTTDIRTTMEIYAEATEESMDDAMNRLSEQLI